jgi:hypothetical protein
MLASKASLSMKKEKSFMTLTPSAAIGAIAQIGF